MNATVNSELICIQNFIASKQIRLFQTLKQHHFSGQLCFRDTKEVEWVFYLYLGRIIYATGGKHPVRRWRRNLVTYLPQIADHLQEELDSLATKKPDIIHVTWDYDLFCFWVEQQKVSREQANQAIRSSIKEILFDITQTQTITYYLKSQNNILAPQLAMVDSEQQVIEAWKTWQQWQEASLSSIFPDLAPNIVSPEKLRAKSSEKIYQALKRLLTGNNSLRDLAIQKKTDILTLTCSLMPYIQLGLLGLVEVSDILSPIVLPDNKNKSKRVKEDGKISSLKKLDSGLNGQRKGLIACVSSSQIISQIMKKIVTQIGYDFISETDPIYSIALLLDRKPDIICIELELSGATAYELCSQLRELSCFAETPIFLFSRNVSLLDRVKAKMAGFSEVFDKSLESKSILDVISKYTRK